MQIQLNHDEFKEKQRKIKNDIIFVLENFEHPENLGSAFRIADSFNIESIFIISKNPLNFNKIHKTARNCEKVVNYKIFSCIDEVLTELEKLKYTPINLEITSSSVPLREMDFKKLKKIAIICGNEKHGVSEETLSKIPQSCYIEMFGNNSSMNVTHALAICAYKISEDLNF